MTASPEADTAEAGAPPAPASVLPPRSLPRVARYARGPWIEPRLVTPTDFRWRDARTYVATDYAGIEWRCVRVTVSGHHYGWWAVERLGLSLMGDTGEPPTYEPGLVVELADGRRIILPAGAREIENGEQPAMNQLEAFDETVGLAERSGMLELPGSSLGLEHLRSMQVRVTNSFSEAKLGRWLGWAQAALVAADVGVSLDDVKQINRRHS